MKNRVIDVISKTQSATESTVQIYIVMDSETHRHLSKCYDSVSGKWSLADLAVLMRAAATVSEDEIGSIKNTRSVEDNRAGCYYCSPNRCMCPNVGYGKVEAR